jgi:hypothetical protein
MKGGRRRRTERRKRGKEEERKEKQFEFIKRGRRKELVSEITFVL